MKSRGFWAAARELVLALGQSAGGGAGRRGGSRGSRSLEALRREERVQGARLKAGSACWALLVGLQSVAKFKLPELP